MKSHDLDSGRFVLGVVFAECFVLTVVPVAADEAEEIKKLEQELPAVQKLVEDPLSGHHEFFAAKGRLRSLDDRASALIEKYAKNKDEDHRLFQVHGKILELQERVRARLPDPPIRPVATGLPVPNFDEEKLLGQLASELRESQSVLAQHLHSSSKKPDETSDLLAKMILAEEELAWEAGWPFTDKEASMHKKAGGLTPEVYLMRRNRGVERINNQLAEDAARVGREPPRRFLIHSPTEKVHVQPIYEHLQKKRGKGASAWNKDTRPFDAEEQRAMLGGH